MTSETLSLKCWIVLSRASQSILKCVEEDVKQYGLNPTEFAVLELLFHKGDQPIQKIGTKILLASSSITYVVDNLEKKGFLIRKSCSQDRRVTYAGITKLGSDLLGEIFPKHQAMIHQLFDGINNEEKEQLIAHLKKLGYRAEGSLT